MPLRTMGRDPIEVLILPRVLALRFAAVADLVERGGACRGGLVTWVYGGGSELFCLTLARCGVDFGLEVAMIKAPFMALGIGAGGCNRRFES